MSFPRHAPCLTLPFVHPSFVDPSFVDPSFVDPSFVDPLSVDPLSAELVPVAGAVLGDASVADPPPDPRPRHLGVVDPARRW